MKTRQLIRILVAALIISGSVLLIPGCGTINWQQIQQTIGSPAQVQIDVSVLSAIAKPRIPANAQAQIHQWATQLAALADLNTAQLVALIPKTGNATADALIASSSGFLNMALARWGEHNPTTLAYVHSVANGLLSNF